MEDWEGQLLQNYTTSASTEEQSEEDEPETEPEAEHVRTTQHQHLLRNKREEDEPETEPEAEPNPLLIHSMSEALKWTRQHKMFYIEKNPPDLVEDSGSMEDKTTRHMITVQCQRKQVTLEDFTQLFARK